MKLRVAGLNGFVSRRNSNVPLTAYRLPTIRESLSEWRGLAQSFMHHSGPRNPISFEHSFVHNEQKRARRPPGNSTAVFSHELSTV